MMSPQPQRNALLTAEGRDRQPGGPSVAIVAYAGMTALDAIGPFDVLRFVPDARVELVASARGPVNTDSPHLTLTATKGFEEMPSPDLVIVPGGPGTRAAMRGPLPEWLRTVHSSTQWTTSVCSGSLLLGAAGLLTGLEATSHFTVLEHLRSFGAQPVARRVVTQQHARIMTAGGVSAGIDMALSLVAHVTDAMTAQAIQLILEYAPDPPYDTGTLRRANSHVIERAIELAQPHGAFPSNWRP